MGWLEIVAQIHATRPHFAFCGLEGGIRRSLCFLREVDRQEGRCGVVVERAHQQRPGFDGPYVRALLMTPSRRKKTANLGPHTLGRAAAGSRGQPWAAAGSRGQPRAALLGSPKTSCAIWAHQRPNPTRRWHFRDGNTASWSDVDAKRSDLYSSRSENR